MRLPKLIRDARSVDFGLKVHPNLTLNSPLVVNIGHGIGSGIPGPLPGEHHGDFPDNWHSADKIISIAKTIPYSIVVGGSAYSIYTGIPAKDLDVVIHGKQSGGHNREPDKDNELINGVPVQYLSTEAMKTSKGGHTNIGISDTELVKGIEVLSPKSLLNSTKISDPHGADKAASLIKSLKLPQEFIKQLNSHGQLNFIDGWHKAYGGDPDDYLDNWRKIIHNESYIHKTLRGGHGKGSGIPGPLPYADPKPPQPFDTHEEGIEAIKHYDKHGGSAKELNDRLVKTHIRTYMKISKGINELGGELGGPKGIHSTILAHSKGTIKHEPNTLFNKPKEDKENLEDIPLLHTATDAAKIANQSGLKYFGNNLFVNGNPNSGHVHTHLADLALVPHELMDALSRQGVKIYLGSGAATTMDGMKELVNQKILDGRSWSGTGGCYYTQKNAVIAGNNAMSGSTSLSLHELGHAVGYHFGPENEPGVRFNDSKVIEQHHNRLYAKLPPYLQNGSLGNRRSGMHELIAEGFADVLKNKTKAIKLYDKEFVEWIEKGILDK